MPDEKDEQPSGDQDQPGKNRLPDAAGQDAGTPVPGGEIKDKEAETSNSYGRTRDSGERPK